MNAMIDREGGARPAHQEWEVTDVEGRPLSTDTRGTIRLGFWILLVGFGAFLLWAAFAPLDEGVSAPGTVSLEMHRTVIQHLTGGVVKKVLVREGQAVKAGDVLIELEDATARANYETVRQNYLGLRAAESRILAEQAGADRITFHPDLIAAESDPTVRQQMTAETRLFDARRQALAAELGAAREAIAGSEAQVTGFARMLASRSAQERLQAEQIASLQTLAAEGYAPRNQVLQLEQSQAELHATIADLQSNRQRALQQIAETKMRMQQRREDFQKEDGTQLAEVRREVEAGQDKLRALSDDLARTKIRTPVGGQVVGLAVASTGGVVTPGQKLMDIVPQGEPLLIDAKIPPQVIDRVRVGESTDVRFAGFSHTPMLVVTGRLVSVSKDVITEPVGAQMVSYYLGRVEVTADGMKVLGHRQLQPGMPAEVLIRTGERSMLTYLLHPLMKRISQSLKEE